MLTKEQLIARRRTIGASEAPILMGLTSYGDPGTILLEKQGLLESEPLKPNKFMTFGNLAEDQIRTLAEEELRRRYETINAICRGERHFERLSSKQGATPDGFYSIPFDQLVLIEVKTTGQNWTNGLPDRVIYQIQQQMDLTGASFCLVPVYYTTDAEIDQALVAWATGEHWSIDPEKLVFMEVETDLNLQAKLRDFCITWWTKHVELGLPLFSLDKEKSKPLFGECEVPMGLEKRYLDAKAAKELAEQTLKDVTLEVNTLMGDFKKGIGNSGNFSKSYIPGKPSLDEGKAWMAAKAILGDKAAPIETAYMKSAGKGYWRLQHTEK